MHVRNTQVGEDSLQSTIYNTVQHTVDYDQHSGMWRYQVLVQQQSHDALVLVTLILQCYRNNINYLLTKSGPVFTASLQMHK